MIEEHEKLIKSCYENFRKADKIIQEVKIFTATEVIPAVLQLRYAGFHLVEFLIDKQEGHLYEANVHSNNAVLESYKYGILFCFDAIDKFKNGDGKKFKNGYGRNILPGMIPDYSIKMRKLEEIKEKIYSDTINVEENYFETLHNMFLESSGILNEFIALYPELNKQMSKKRKILKIIPIILPIIIAIIVTIIFK